MLSAVSSYHVGYATFNSASPEGINFALILDLARQYARGNISNQCY